MAASFKNDFTWSKSRDEVFRKCPRQYYFNYYGSWGGWYPNPDERTYKIYVLKRLMNRHAWVGDRVHQCIKIALQNIRRNIPPMSGAEAIETTISIMRQDFKNSQMGGYWKRPKSCGLFEHEYNIKMSDAEWKEAADHAAACLNTFYNSEVFESIKGISTDYWLEIEEFSHFILEGTKIWVVMDFCSRAGEEIHIYDWKTGRSEPKHHEIQLAGYSYYAVEKWKVRPEQVKTIEFNLSGNKIHYHHPEGIHLASIRKYITGSIRDMKLLLDNAEENIASEEKFAYTENTHTCRSCQFKKVCPKWDKAPG